MVGRPLFRIRVNDFDSNALCDLGASSSSMPKSLYDMLDLEPLDESILGVHLIDSTVNRPLGRDDNVSLGEFFPLYLRLINLILIISPSFML